MRVLIFGGGFEQISLINNAINNQFFTVVIDPDNACPGQFLADRYYCVDGDDYEMTKKVIKNENINGIASTSTDKPLLMMARVAEEFGFKFPSYLSVENTINKWKFKAIATANNIPVAQGKLFINSNHAEIKEIKTFPVIIKPVSSSGSRGVIKCDSSEELIRQYGHVNKMFPYDGVIVEDYIEGKEYSIEGLVTGNELSIVQITEKTTGGFPYNVELQHIQPASLSTFIEHKIQKVLCGAIKVLKLKNCAIHAEIKIFNDQVYIIEIGPRLGGGFINSHLTPWTTSVNIELELLKIALCLPSNICKENKNYALVRAIVLAENHTVKCLNFNFNDLQEEYDIFLYSKIKIPFKVPKLTDGLQRYFWIALQDTCLDRLMTRANKVEKVILKRVIYE